MVTSHHARRALFPSLSEHGIAAKLDANPIDPSRRGGGATRGAHPVQQRLCPGLVMFQLKKKMFEA